MHLALATRAREIRLDAIAICIIIVRIVCRRDELENGLCDRASSQLEAAVIAMTDRSTCRWPAGHTQPRRRSSEPVVQVSPRAHDLTCRPLHVHTSICLRMHASDRCALHVSVGPPVAGHPSSTSSPRCSSFHPFHPSILSSSTIAVFQPSSPSASNLPPSLSNIRFPTSALSTVFYLGRLTRQVG